MEKYLSSIERIKVEALGFQRATCALYTIYKIKHLGTKENAYIVHKSIMYALRVSLYLFNQPFFIEVLNKLKILS